SRIDTTPPTISTLFSLPSAPSPLSHSFPTRRSSDLPLTGNAHLDALAGAVAEYLSRQYELPGIPPWAFEPVRYLDHPWHASSIEDRKSTRLNSSHVEISYAVFCLKKKKKTRIALSSH